MTYKALSRLNRFVLVCVYVNGLVRRGGRRVCWMHCIYVYVCQLNFVKMPHRHPVIYMHCLCWRWHNNYIHQLPYRWTAMHTRTHPFICAMCVNPTIRYNCVCTKPKLIITIRARLCANSIIETLINLGQVIPYIWWHAPSIAHASLFLSLSLSRIGTTRYGKDK